MRWEKDSERRVTREEEGRKAACRRTVAAPHFDPRRRGRARLFLLPITARQLDMYHMLSRLAGSHVKSNLRLFSTPAAPPHSPAVLSTVLPTAVDTSSPEFIERAAAMAVLEKDLAALRKVVEAGGGEQAQAKARKAGKLLVRERCALLFFLGGMK